MPPLYIFDLDGTLALIEHRIHFLSLHFLSRKDPARWRKFYAACDQDRPNMPLLTTLELLRAAGAEIWIFSGRSDEVRHKTIVWLAKHSSLTTQELNGHILTMRAEGDHTPDDVLKKQWLDAMSSEDRQRLVAVFEDRARVVDMWRAAGVQCFAIAPGEF